MADRSSEQSGQSGQSGVCALKVLEQVNLKAVEASPDAEVIADSDGIMVVFNQRAELMFGWSREEVLGKSVEMLIPEGLRVRHVASREGYMADPRLLETGAGRVLVGLHRRGHEFRLQVCLAPLVVVGAGVYVLAILRRVTEVAVGGGGKTVMVSVVAPPVDQTNGGSHGGSHA